MERSCTCGGANSNCRWCSGTGYTNGPLPDENSTFIINPNGPRIPSTNPGESAYEDLSEVEECTPNAPAIQTEPLPIIPTWLIYLLIFISLLLVVIHFS